ncbi:MAG: VOC family protein [Bacteroidota bacterium]
MLRMYKPFKPEGHTSLSPYVIARDVEQVLAFAVDVFGGRTVHRETVDGRTRHAEVVIDDSILMIGGDPKSAGGMATLHVYVPDVDETFERAIQAGGHVLQAPERRRDVDRRAGVRGPEGNGWWFATQQERRRGHASPEA